LLIEQHSPPPANKCSLIDIGCGEGFAIKFFKNKGFSVLGLDYGIEGAQRQNPSITQYIIQGDMYSNIDDLISHDKQFDVVNMDNVMEHVTKPKALLQRVRGLLKDNGIAIIKVPNDFSYLQKYFFEHGIAKKTSWVAPPDHLQYFNKEGLINICNDVGLKCVDFLSDQLIELFAFNPNTNYFENKSVGKSCHMSRVAFENIFHDISPEKTIELYRVLGSMGIGRGIIGIFKKQ
jgi:2-polyprenyl-3-methyl-5-hydroxy-6-metoxy-1,4-benzoquinol methylase